MTDFTNEFEITSVDWKPLCQNITDFVAFDAGAENTAIYVKFTESAATPPTSSGLGQHQKDVFLKSKSLLAIPWARLTAQDETVKIDITVLP